jgi:hypothetical protein
MTTVRDSVNLFSGRWLLLVEYEFANVVKWRLDEQMQG